MRRLVLIAAVLGATAVLGAVGRPGGWSRSRGASVPCVGCCDATCREAPDGPQQLTLEALDAEVAEIRARLAHGRMSRIERDFWNGRLNYLLSQREWLVLCKRK